MFLPFKMPIALLQFTTYIISLKSLCICISYYSTVYVNLGSETHLFRTVTVLQVGHERPFKINLSLPLELLYLWLNIYIKTIRKNDQTVRFKWHILQLSLSCMLIKVLTWPCSNQLMTWMYWRPRYHINGVCLTWWHRYIPELNSESGAECKKNETWIWLKSLMLNLKTTYCR